MSDGVQITLIICTTIVIVIYLLSAIGRDDINNNKK